MDGSALAGDDNGGQHRRLKGDGDVVNEDLGDQIRRRREPNGPVSVKNRALTDQVAHAQGDAHEMALMFSRIRICAASLGVRLPASAAPRPAWPGTTRANAPRMHG